MSLHSFVSAFAQSRLDKIVRTQQPSNVSHTVVQTQVSFRDLLTAENKMIHSWYAESRCGLKSRLIVIESQHVIK